MSDVEIKLPIFADSTAKLLNWQKQIGDEVREGERLIEVETDKVILEILAPQSGKITKLLKANNESVLGEETIAILASSEVKPTEINPTKNTDFPSSTMTTSCNQFVKHPPKIQPERAILTVFDEVNVQNVQDLWGKYKQSIVKQQDIKYGLLTFFTKAVVVALKKFTIINTSTVNDDIVYHDYYNIGITIANSYITPVLCSADTMSFVNMEKNIADFTERVNQLSVKELAGGTFTIVDIVNSMLSIPYLNSSQNAILGIHNIVERPIAENGEIVIRPMVFIALSYNQSLINSNEAVQFLLTVKNLIEDPNRLLLEI
ncbi:MAG: 2-oxo acid dehydrogenase subunit E2 [Candidatus Marithrix sp.]|nr:2-oxo acid dehydrogenase subunit E2 [Candidatus Marithrix sp.]